MPNIVRVHDDALLSRHTEILTQGATSGRFVTGVPFPADYVAILNQTEATIYFVEGEQYSQSPEVTPVEPGGYISTRIRETQKVTCFWASTGALPAGATATLVFSNEPIPLQAGNLTPNATTSNVAVTNTPNVNVSSLPNVSVTSLPPLPAGTNNIGDVDVLTLPATNAEGTALASAARTITTSSVDIANDWGTGIHIIFDVTAVATSDVKVKVEGKDPASGKYYTILEGASVTAVSTNIYKVYPGLTAAANLVASDILPKTIRLTVTHANANSTTYSVGYSLV